MADATTAIPLWIAFKLAQRKPTSTFTYGYGRVEDLAGIAIVLVILASALVAGYQLIDRIFHPQPITLLGWVAMAGLTALSATKQWRYSAFGSAVKSTVLRSWPTATMPAQTD